jgi:hypothetical protein
LVVSAAAARYWTSHRTLGPVRHANFGALSNCGSMLNARARSLKAPRGYRPRDSEDIAAPPQEEDDIQRSTPIAFHTFRVLADPTPERRALDEMERLALTQVAAARKRKREILAKHGLPISGRTPAKILVMPCVASTEV